MKHLLLSLVVLLSFCSISNADPIKIRMLILKHSPSRMADNDADLAIRATEKARTKGLDISLIGNYNIDKNGRLQAVLWGHQYDLPRLKAFVSQEMKRGAVEGDTVIVFTIGHGHETGNLNSLGQRCDVMKAIVESAEENNQKTLWWQLSCHATARLPSIKSLTDNQQHLVSIYASSPAEEESAAGVQGKIMEKVFLALAENSAYINPNKDDVITAGEIRGFLNANRLRGELFFACDSNEPIFGEITPLARKIPIIDCTCPQGNYPRDFLPLPTKIPRMVINTVCSVSYNGLKRLTPMNGCRKAKIPFLRKRLLFRQ